MTVRYKTTGFVFKREDRQEADRIFSVFTQDFGRIEIFAKSIRHMASKLKGGIEIFSICELSFIQGKNRKTLVDAAFVQKFNGIVQNLEKTEIAYNIFNLLDVFLKWQEPDKKIWDLVVDIFTKLNNPELANNKFLYYYFFWNLVAVLGYCPELSTCAACGQLLSQNDVYFSNIQGGAICKNCFPVNKDAKKINADVVKIMRLILKKDLDILHKLKIQTNSKILLKEISYSYNNYLAEGVR